MIFDGLTQPDHIEIDVVWERACEKFGGLGDDDQVRSLRIYNDAMIQILEYIKTRVTSPHSTCLE